MKLVRITRSRSSALSVRCALVTLLLMTSVMILLFRTENFFFARRVFSQQSIVKVDNLFEERRNHRPTDWMDRNGSEVYNRYGDGTCPVNEYRENYIFIMTKWLEISEKYDIEYFLTYGSLLGAWRSEDVIPWDEDLDVHVKVEDFIHIANLTDKKTFDTEDGMLHVHATKDWRKPFRMRRRFDCDGTKVDEYSGQCSFVEPSARLIRGTEHLDVYLYSTFYETVRFLIDNGGDYLKSDIFPLTRCMYMGMEFRCPRNARAILDVTYSNKLLPRDMCINGTFQRNEIAYMSPEEVEKIRVAKQLDEIIFMSTEDVQKIKEQMEQNKTSNQLNLLT